MTQTYIRWFLSVLLIVGVYTETGIFTTIFAGTMCIASEIDSWRIRIETDQRKRLK